MKRAKKYKQAFRVACELLNGDMLYGYDADKIFEDTLDKDGVVTPYSYERYILRHLDKLTGGRR